MAQRLSVVAAEATSVPEPQEIARVATFVREPFVGEGEDPAEVLTAGSIRRHAFEAARTELDAGAGVPSQKWRRRWSLLLGLDRTLSTETPVLADGTTLNPHQVDALSGTYAALLADAQRRARGGSGLDGDALLLSFEVDEPTEHDEPPAQVAPEEPDESFDDDGPGDPETPEDEDDEGGAELEELELEELPDAEPESESALYDDEAEEDVDEDIDAAALEDPNAHKRFWFEHATGAGKTVAAMGFVEACRTGGVLILTHRRNLVDQFIDELQTRGYGERLSKPLLGDDDRADGPVTIETYQWFVRNAGQISGAYTVVICDEAHTALGEKTSATIRAWTGPIFIGMTATGALIARHVTDLFPTQTSRFDLAQAARRGVIAPLRSLRIPPGPGVRTIAKVPLRKGEVDMEFDQDELAKLLDQAPFNLAIADLYKTRFRNTPGVVYTAGVKHAYNVAESFRALDMKAEAVSGETPKRELAKILADYEAGDIDVLVNAQLLAEGWNSPRATICMHLAPTASKRIYQQRVGRVTRRHPGKEAGVVIDFVHPATSNDDPVVTLHSLLDRDVYRGGAIVVGPVRRGRGRRVKVERRVLPVTPDIERRRQVFERELWRIAVEQLDWGEQRVWAALAGAKASPTNWRRGRAMLNFDRSGELRRQFLITALERNRNPQLRMRAIQEIAVLREAEPFDTAIDFVGQWPREERREASRTLLQAMADRRIGRRDQATAWIWRLAEYTRDMHEEYAAQRWPATKHLLGLLVNSSGAAHARNARRLVHAARQHDRRLQAALLAAAVAHTPEAEEVLREARTRLARKPGALSRDLLKDFPNGKRRKKRTRKKKNGGGEQPVGTGGQQDGAAVDGEGQDGAVAVAQGDGQPGQNGGQGGGQHGNGEGGSSRSRRNRSRGGRRRGRSGRGGEAQAPAPAADGAAEPVAATEDPDVDRRVEGEEQPQPRRRIRGGKAADAAAAAEASQDGAPMPATSDDAPAPGPDEAPRPRRRTRGAVDAAAAAPTVASAAPVAEAEATPTRRRRTRSADGDGALPPTSNAAPSAASQDAPATTASPPPDPEATGPTRKRTTRSSAARPSSATDAVADAGDGDAPKPKRAARSTATRAKASTATKTAAKAKAATATKATATKTATKAKAATATKAAADTAAETASPAKKATAGTAAAKTGAARKPAAGKASSTKTTAARKPAAGKTAAAKATAAGKASSTKTAAAAKTSATAKTASKAPAKAKPTAAKAAKPPTTKTAAKPSATRSRATTRTTATKSAATTSAAKTPRAAAKTSAAPSSTTTKTPKAAAKAPAKPRAPAKPKSPTTRAAKAASPARRRAAAPPVEEPS